MKIERPISKQPIPPSAKRVFQGQMFDVYQWEQELYDGTRRTFEKVRRADTAVVLPVTPDGKIILAKEEQPGKKLFLTTVGGRIEDGEDPLAAGKRELLEETGYESAEWELLAARQPLTKVDWAIYTFIAKGCVRVAEQKLDGGEKIELLGLSFDAFVEAVLRDDFDDVALKLVLLEAKTDPEKMKKIKAQFGFSV